VADVTQIIEFKSLSAQLKTAHEALVDDYTELADLTWRVLVSALGVGTSEGSNGF